MTLYGYFYNSCIYESAPGLVSLHQTKAGAWRAMRANKWEAAVLHRENDLRYGNYGHPDAYIPQEWEAHFIRPVEVLP